MATDWRHPYPAGADLDEVLASLPDDQAVSVAQYGPYWDVVVKLVDGQKAFFVSDSSRSERATKVFGPVPTRGPAEAMARAFQAGWIMTHQILPEGNETPPGWGL